LITSHVFRRFNSTTLGVPRIISLNNKKAMRRIEEINTIQRSRIMSCHKNLLLRIRLKDF